MNAADRYKEAVMQASEEVSSMTEEEVRQFLFSILVDSYALGVNPLTSFIKSESRKPPTDLNWTGATSER